MKEVVQVVRLNDFEIDIAAQMEPVLRKLGKGYRWRRDIIQGYEIKFHIEDVTKDRVILTGQLGAPKFRLKIVDKDAAFTTVNSIAPEGLFYDLVNILMSQHGDGFLSRQLVPQSYDKISTNPNDYYIMNNSYSGKISEYFRMIQTSKKDPTYRSGMFYFEMAAVDWGNEKLRVHVKEFAEKSFYNEVLINYVFHRGNCIPFFYGNGAVFCPIAEKDYVDAMLEDFTRIFMKCATPNWEKHILDLTKAK